MPPSMQPNEVRGPVKQQLPDRHGREAVTLAAGGRLMMHVVLGSGRVHASLPREAGERLLVPFGYGMARLVGGPQPDIVEI